MPTTLYQERLYMTDNMITEISWKDFRETGLLWYVNRILHVFGLVIVFEFDDTGEISRVFPARCKFRGFTEEIDDKGFKNVGTYLQDNIDEIQKETNEG